jgi:parvulin-like peptidyl-prolyl isomerase
MAVMQNMREFTKTGLIILVLAFIGTIIFDWGMDFTGLSRKQGVIGEVNGTEIPAVQYERLFAAELDAYRNRTGQDDISETQIQFIRNQVWDNMVRNILVQEAIHEKGIVASDAEIVHRIFNDPPDFLRDQEAFQNENKQFDMARYQAALNDNNLSGQWREIEEYLRATIPGEKLQQHLQSSVRVTDEEIKQEYSKQNQNAEVKYLFFDPNSYRDQTIEISDEQIKSYYEKNKDEYQEEEKRRIQYAMFNTAATAEDSTGQWELANQLIEQVKAGENFGELAEIYSTDEGSKDKGGDLGFFGKGQMVKEFETAAFDAKVGEVVGPIKSRFGLHVIKVEDKRTQNGKEEVKASHILLKFEASVKTKNRARDDANYFVTEAASRPFAEVAKELNAKLDTTAFFARGTGFIPGIGLNVSASNFIFTNSAGKTGNLEEVPQGYLVFNILAIQGERIKPLADVSESIKDKLMADKRKEMAGEAAQKVYEKIQSGTSFDAAATEGGLEIKNSGSFARSGFVQTVGRDPNFIGAAFGLEQVNAVSKPISGTRGYYLLQLTQKGDFDANDFAAKREAVKQQLLSQKQNQVFANWYNSLKSEADIRDYRERFY